MRNTPKPQEIYRHFKGNLYRIVTLAQHTETGDILVIYEALYGEFKIYARDLKMFLEQVDRTKYPLSEYPEYTQTYRFELVSDNEPAETLIKKTSEESEHFEYTEEPITDSTEDTALDPLLYEFLDADTYQQRLNIMAALQHRITDEMINTMAVSMDVEIEDGDIMDRYEQLKNCLLTRDRYEHSRP